MKDQNIILKSDAAGFSQALCEPHKYERLIIGQKMILSSVLMYILLGLAASLFQAFWVVALFVFMLIFAVIGMLKVIRALNIDGPTKFLLYLAIALPPLGLIAFVYLNNVATQELQIAGYRIGIFGAKKTVNNASKRTESTRSA